MVDDALAFGLDWDRDYFVNFARRYLEVFWPISVLLVHPFVIFVLIFKTSMILDCKIAFVVQHMSLLCFDFYNGFLYQMYPLAPIPAFICTGYLCNGAAEGSTMLTGMAFWTVVLCVPYLVIILRMHQRMILQGSPLKVSTSVQVLVLLFLSSTLAANVFGFHYWAVDTPRKIEIMEYPEIAWAKQYATNFLKLGNNEGDIGNFVYELTILLLSIFINFSFYIFITYHCINRVGKNLACCSATFFISPLLLLFIGLEVVRVRWLFPNLLVALFRIVMLLLYCSCSISHCVVFLSKNPWFLQHTRRLMGRAEEGNKNTVTTISAPQKNRRL